ncbi:hypothetical protein [Pseudoalteromonas luteoviolacea]|uniref:hypothetical protein n=1 Tax=Pseudoalteromonas luteoviolacea TaxID=43657 RepID=UPI001B378DA1|nr:hypothetical protein [Pseudoalteromonas luteoviolacea]MBQ4834789.1 hypothetical protein [Pseudoalteromonas luteoviolacea]
MARLDQAIASAKVMASNGCPASQILRHLSIDHGISDTLSLVQIFKQAFSANIGEISCIGGWTEDGSGELNDEAINSLLQVVIGSRA